MNGLALIIPRNAWARPWTVRVEALEALVQRVVLCCRELKLLLLTEKHQTCTRLFRKLFIIAVQLRRRIVQLWASSAGKARAELGGLGCIASY